MRAIINSYAQVFFSKNKILGSILLAITFFDFTIGVCGLLSVVSGLVFVKLLDVEKEGIKEGLYGFNNILVGLGIGLYFQLSIYLLVIVVFASIFTTLITLGMKGILAKYGLPYLSLPFLIGLWISLMAAHNFSVLGISSRGVYLQNEHYSLGGIFLVNFYETINAATPDIIASYFKSLGAIFFQYNIIAGILISIGLLIYSRIAFSLSILGYLSAVGIYQFFGADITQLEYGYLGFNYILTAIAIGGFFYVPSRNTYLSALLLLPMLMLLSFALERTFNIFGLPIYSLPFNIIVLLFLHALHYRNHRPVHLHEIKIQQDTPEENLYLYNNNMNRYALGGLIPLALPFLGEWSVSQGYNGDITHKGEWRHGLDFIILDSENKQYKANGDTVNDYYCYNKHVTAPTDGYVVDIIDNIEDNRIGKVDLTHNWGNSIVIQHQFGLCTQVSHLKKGSITVKKGDHVLKRDIIGKVGNSGRSPFPHLHFQVQSSPYVGAKTLNYPISSFFINKKQHQTFNIPKQGDTISQIELFPFINNAFSFEPNQSLKFKVEGGKKSHLKDFYHFIIKSDTYNNTYIQCNSTGAIAWFVRNNDIFYFSNYQGTKKSLLYFFMLALFKVELAYLEETTITETVPLHLIERGIGRYIHDFAAPFVQYDKPKYKMNYAYIDDNFAPQQIKLSSTVYSKMSKEKNNYKFDISITKNGIESIVINGSTKVTRYIKNESEQKNS